MHRLYQANFPYLFFTATSVSDFSSSIMLNILLGVVLAYLPALYIFNYYLFCLINFYANAKNVFIHAIAVTLTSFAHAQQFNYKLDGPFKTSKTFKVQGTCEMCKHRIESAINNLPGVWSSNWDVSSKTLMVTYDRSKVKPAIIEKLVSGQGHDIDSMDAATDVYSKLPDCCHSRENPK